MATPFVFDDLHTEAFDEFAYSKLRRVHLQLYSQNSLPTLSSGVLLKTILHRTNSSHLYITQDCSCTMISMSLILEGPVAIYEEIDLTITKSPISNRTSCGCETELHV